MKNSASLITLKNTKYFHLLYYEFTKTTNAIYFPIATPQKIQTILTTIDNKLSLNTCNMPDLFTEKDFIDLEDERNININKDYKNNSYGINEYLTLLSPDIIYKTALCPQSFNLIACRSDNIYIYDYTKHSQLNQLDITIPCKTLLTKKSGFGLDWKKYLVSTGEDKEIIIYDIHSNKETRYKTISKNSDIKNEEDLCYFIGDDKKLSLFDLRGDKSFYSINNIGYSIDISNSFISIGMKNSFNIFDKRNLNSPIFEFNINEIQSNSNENISIVKFNPHENILLSGFTNGVVTIHDLYYNKIKYINDYQQCINNVEWNPLQFGEFIVSGEVNSSICLPDFFINI